MFFILAFAHFILRGIHAAPITASLAHDDLLVLAGESPCVCPTNHRAVLDIIWSCVATIFTCSWVAVHPNIPSPSIKGWWRGTLPRLELMAWTILAPEIMIYWAMRQWKGVQEMQETFGKYDGWTKTHGYFLQMGGFVIFDGDTPQQILGYGKLLNLLEAENISRDINASLGTQADIEDRSKGDAISKAFVLGQTTWFVTQCISRRAQNIATTELELITLAFAVLSGFMYFFWWDKPLDVYTPVRVYLKPDLTPDEKSKVLEGLSKWDEIIPSYAQARQPNVPPDHLYQWPVRAIQAVYQRLLDMCVFSSWRESGWIRTEATYVHIFYAHNLRFHDTEKMQAIASLIAALFGAIHCVGWNFSFPSTIESSLWRISSVIVTTCPLLMEVRFLLYESGEYERPVYKFPELQMAVWSFTVYIALPLYLLARIILTVEAILTLRDLSPSALAIVRWSSFLPHI